MPYMERGGGRLAEVQALWWPVPRSTVEGAAPKEGSANRPPIVLCLSPLAPGPALPRAG